MERIAPVVFDAVAIVVLTIVVYFPRYRRRDMVLAYLGLNVGIMAVAVALTENTSVGTGFGLGLFGTLSIIRLRSAELAHQEIAYYFAALALGMIGGIEVTPLWTSFALSASIVAVMFVGDHPALFRGYRHQVVVLDRAIAADDRLVAALEELLGAQVVHVEPVRLDVVNDTTVVDVRYRTNGTRHLVSRPR